MSVSAHRRFQVAPGCNVLAGKNGKFDLLKAGTVFNDAASIGCSAESLKDMIESGHVLVLDRRSDEVATGDNHAVENMPGQEIRALKAVDGKGDKPVDADKVGLAAKTEAEKAGTAGRKTATQDVSPFNLDPGALFGKSLETLNGMIVERGGKEVESTKDAVATLSAHFKG